MKPHLLFRDQTFSPRWGMISTSPTPALWRDRDFDLQWEMLPADRRTVTQDLELEVLFEAMARGDRFLFEVAKNVVLLGVTDTDTIRYRQEILRDCLKNPGAVRALYALAVELIERHREEFRWRSAQSADSILSSSIRALERFTSALTDLRTTAVTHAATFESEGFTALVAMLGTELTDGYFAGIREILEELKFPRGALIRVELGEGNKGTGYALQRSRKVQKQGLMRRLFSREQPSQYSFTIHERDDAGFRALAELRGRGINTVSNALAQSTDHILAFFIALKMELAFYIGCLNLYEELARMGEPVCIPVPLDRGNRALAYSGLYDPCMALRMGRGVVGNDADAERADLVIITGANRGGKSTLLRSLGLAQVMMQCGLFVPAQSFRSDVCDGIFTHFKREEDPTMRSGKLDEELGRMSEIVDRLTPDCLVLFNESFAATNEREGSEIARQIVCALLERRVKVIFVTHLYEFSRSLYEKKMENAVFLRAERMPDGERTFRVTEGEPLQTSYGEDLYARIFSELPPSPVPDDTA